ncbi:MAG TPA: Fe-S cluster assembly protein SufD [Anaerolineae bacterium]|nr:Fe-S cluster assembly protein SufD [Anaerolineae bacterium]
MAVKSLREPRNSKPRDFSFTLEDVRIDVASQDMMKYRMNAYETFKVLPFPDKRSKDWHNIKLSDLDPRKYQLFNQKGTLIDSIPDVKKANKLFPLETSAFVIHANGVVKTLLSPELKEQGIIFTDLITAMKENKTLFEEHLGKIVSPSEGKFAALTAAFSKQGLFCYIPKNVNLTSPLVNLVCLDDDYTVHPFHLFIFLDEGSSATIFHGWSSSEDSQGESLFSGITEIDIGRNATLNLYEVQSLNNESWNFSHERARIGKEGAINWFYLTRGSRFTKSFINLDMVGDNGKGIITGVYFPSNTQQFDFDTRQNHYALNTKSDLLFRGVMRDISKSVWQGMIYVDKKALKADGYQVNNNLMLSSSAHTIANPGLEILTDDVRCSHGVTITEIDLEQLFYLQSRGIDKQQSVKLIVNGFLNSAISRAGDKSIAELLINGISI